MKGFRRALAVAALAVVLGAVAARPAAGAQEATPGLPVQLALGDSWVSGAGASDPSETAYVPQLHTVLRERLDCLPAEGEPAGEGCKHLQLLNLGRGGATTPTMVAQQFPLALPLLESRNADANRANDVELITIHIGGNDVTNPILAACLGGLTTACLQTIQSEFTAFAADIDAALSTLRGAAGSATPIVIGTYDNPIPTCQLGAVPGASTLAALVLEGGGPIPQGLHDIIRTTAANHGVDVAEVFGDLAPADWVGGTDCLHPDDSGYDKVTDAFLEALGLA